MNKILFLILFIPVMLQAEQAVRIDISDTNITKNLYDIAIDADGNFFLAAFDYNGGGIYKSNINSSDAPYDMLLQADDLFLFSTAILNFNTERTEDDIWLAAGYFKNCQCGVLLKKDSKSAVWNEVFFDELDNPFTANIFSIATNTNKEDGTSFNRVFLACANGIIYYSDDTAKTFLKAKINADNYVIKKIAFVDNQTGYAIAGKDRYLSDKLYKTSDSGSTWTLIKDFSTDLISVNDISASNDTIVLCGSKLSKGMMMFSIDAGENFQFIKYQNKDTFPIPFIFVTLKEESRFAVDENGVVYKNEGNLKEWTLYSANSSLGKFTGAKVINGNLIFYGYNGKVYYIK